MAATITMPMQDELKGITERGIHSFKHWHLVFDGNGAYSYIEIDTLNMGGVALCWFINNLTANGALTGVKFTPQVSMDRSNWTDIAWKNLTGSATASGETTIAQNTTQFICLNFSSYPELLCARWFRLKLNASTNAATVFDVFACLK